MAGEGSCTRMLNALDNYISSRMDTDINRLLNNYKDWYEEHMNKCIDNFYKDYTPKYYNRYGDPSSHTGGLYNIFSCEVVDDDVEYTSGDERIYCLPPHHQDNSTVWDIVGNQGVHGGIGIINGRYNPPPLSPPPAEEMARVEREWLDNVSREYVNDFFSNVRNIIMS